MFLDNVTDTSLAVTSKAIHFEPCNLLSKFASCNLQDLDSAQEATAPGGRGGRMATAHRELVHLPLIPQEFDPEAVEAWKLQR